MKAHPSNAVAEAHPVVLHLASVFLVEPVVVFVGEPGPPVPHITLPENGHPPIKGAVFPVRLGISLFAIFHIFKCTFLSYDINKFFIAIDAQKVRYLSHIGF